MHTNTFSEQDRTTLLETLKRFRLSEDKSLDDYRNRDVLEQKLMNGGELNETEIYILTVAAGKVVTDEDSYQHLLSVLGE